MLTGGGDRGEENKTGGKQGNKGTGKGGGREEEGRQEEGHHDHLLPREIGDDDM